MYKCQMAAAEGDSNQLKLLVSKFNFEKDCFIFFIQNIPKFEQNQKSKRFIFIQMQ